MKEFPPNLDPKLYTLLAVLIGYALIDNFNAAEQNAIGNWFITIGQILENNSAWQQVIESRITGSSININSEKFKKTGNPFTDTKAWVKTPTDKEFDQIKKTLKIMQDEIDRLRDSQIK